MLDVKKCHSIMIVFGLIVRTVPMFFHKYMYFPLWLLAFGTVSVL